MTFHLFATRANQRCVNHSDAISEFWKFEILRPFRKTFQYSKCLKHCQKLVVQIRYMQRKERSLITLGTHFCVADSFWTAKRFRYPAITPAKRVVLLPWLICLTKVARFLEVSCNIMHYSCRKLQKVHEMQSLGRFWQETSGLSCKKCLLSRSEVSLQDSFKETCKLFLYLQDNSVVVRFLQVFSDASLSCKIFSRYLWRIILGNFSVNNIKYNLESLIMPLLTSSSDLLAVVSSGN